MQYYCYQFFSCVCVQCGLPLVTIPPIPFNLCEKLDDTTALVAINPNLYLFYSRNQFSTISNSINQINQYPQAPELQKAF